MTTTLHRIACPGLHVEGHGHEPIMQFVGAGNVGEVRRSPNNRHRLWIMWKAHKFDPQSAAVAMSRMEAYEHLHPKMEF